MSRLSQAGRPMRVKTRLGDDELLLQSFTGHEAVSQPFEFTLELLSENDRVAASDMLRSPVTLTIERDSGDPVYLHGMIRRFVQLGQRDGLTHYRAEVVPWLWFLALSHDCRIFQDKTVLEVVEQVFKGLGQADFRKSCSGTYPKREFCVQYRESDLNFVSRLLEEEGIHYFFEHSNGKHVLVLSDQSPLAAACDGGATPVSPDSVRGADAITTLETDHAVHIGEVELRDFDFQQAPRPIAVTMKGDTAANGREKYYDYHPGRFTKMDRGDSFARLRLEADEAQRQLLRGSGTCRHFRSGYRFDLRGYYRSDANGGYLLTSVTHRAAGGDWRSGDDLTVEYEVDFVAIPIKVPYRPRVTTGKPVINGSQTAMVVGKSGEEIWVDKYGRVKVQFHWDRAGKNDESSSCWVRVSTAWAGRQWGIVQIPRIGEEVIIDFLEGDPDQPIIVGRVYNADSMPPYELPANKTQSGMKTRSSSGGSAQTFNEIRFEDRKDSEELYIHAEKDKTVVVENDRTESVGHDEKITIENDRTESVGNDESVSIGANRTHTVGKDETVEVGGKRSTTVGDDETVQVGGAREETVSGDETVTISGKRAITIRGNDERTVSGKDSLSVTGAIEIDGKGGVTITSPKSIELKVGGSTVTIDAKGIAIKGPIVEVEGTATASLKAKAVTVEGVIAAEMKGAITKVTASGMLQARGSITMIN